MWCEIYTGFENIFYFIGIFNNESFDEIGPLENKSMYFGWKFIMVQGFLYKFYH